MQSNYFGKGNTTSYDRGGFHDVETPVDTFHKYAFEWTNSSMNWIIDGTVVRTLKYEDAVGGKNYPQTPARLSLGVWSAGTEKTNKYTVECEPLSVPNRLCSKLTSCRGRWLH